MINIREGICYGECCELCKTVESPICTSETNNAIYVKKKKEEEEDSRKGRMKGGNRRGRRTMRDYGL